MQVSNKQRILDYLIRNEEKKTKETVSKNQVNAMDFFANFQSRTQVYYSHPNPQYTKNFKRSIASQLRHFQHKINLSTQASIDNKNKQVLKTQPYVSPFQTNKQNQYSLLHKRGISLYISDQQRKSMNKSTREKSIRGISSHRTLTNIVIGQAKLKEIKKELSEICPRKKSSTKIKLLR